jgi:CHAT domain-containing protein
VNVRRLVDHLLSITDGKEQQAFLRDHRDDLGLECFTELKARSDALLLEQPQRALEIAEVAMQAASFASLPLAAAIAGWARGNAWVYLGQFEQALEDYGRACAIYGEQDSLAVARLHTNMVGVLTNLGRYGKALALADAARGALQPWGQSRYLATLEMNVGSACRLVGRYADALAAYERGRAIFIALDDPVQAAQMDINRARALVCMDRFHEAEALLQDAGRVLTSEGKSLPAAQVELNLATLLSRQGRHRQALETYARARAAFAALDVATDVAVADLYCTYDYLALNLLPEALELAGAAQATLARLGMPRYVALAAGNHAVAARKLGHHAEALDTLLSARAFFAAQGAAAEMALLDVERAGVLCEMGDLVPAVAIAAQATEALADHNLPLQTARARLTLADCLLAQGDVDGAAAQYARDLDALGEIPALVWRAHDGLGQTAEARGQAQEACVHYGEAITCIEAAEEELGIDEFRAGFLDDKLAVYQRAVRLALTLGDRETAFSRAEQAKTGVWRDFLAQPGAPDERQAQLRALRQEWHWLYNRLARPDEDEETLRGGEATEAHWAGLRALERQIAQARRAGSPTLQRQAVLALADVQQRIPADTLLLDYYCAGETIVAFLIGAANVQVFERLASLEAVERAVNRWRFNVESARFAALDGQHSASGGLSDEAQDVLQVLCRLLIEPLRPRLAGCRALLISPHGPLWAVPFAALHDGRRYLVQDFELTCLPGLAGLQQDTQGETGALADAPLIVGHSAGGRLLHAVSEARSVAAALGGGELLLEDEATTERLRAAAPACTLLHLATHGFFRADAPRFSALRLADDWLTAGDLEEWALPRAGLVTLSACESGVTLGQGSDMLGLARGFFRAGAQRLLVSQWAVDDASTAELIVRFYGALQAVKTAASALQEAQVAALERYRHPFYWAGFQLMARL